MNIMRILASSCRAAAAGGLNALLIGCGGASPSEPAAVDRIVIQGSSSLASGATLQLTATVIASDGAVLADRTVSWSSSNATVATVDNAGVVQAGMIREGTPQPVTIRASTEGKSGSIQLSVNPVPVAVVQLSPANPVIRRGQDLPLIATLRGSDGVPLTGRTLQWMSLSPSIAAVSPQGVVTGVAPGATEIRATAEGVDGTVMVTVPPTPTVSLSVANAPAYTVAGDVVTLTWAATGSATCEAAGTWSGARGTAGSEQVTLGTSGRLTFGLRCLGPGGEASTETIVVARRPVLPTSYANFKANGVQPTWLPRFNDATAYADFGGTGSAGLFTAPMRYDPTRPIGEAGPGLFEFWQLAPDQVSWLPLSITVAAESPPCMHPRKAVVTDVNGDRRPDLYVLCHGYDALPFPGEPSMVLVSQPDGSYRQKQFSPRIGFYHGGATCDLNGDGRPELVTADGAGIQLWRLSPDGTGTLDASHPISQIVGQYYTVECLDVDLDGALDLIIGGHEPVGFPNEVATEIVFGAWTGTLVRQATASIAGYEIVLDFTVTGSASRRTLWVLRTSRFPGYVDSKLQRVDLSSMASSVANSGPTWFPWLIPFTRSGGHFLGTNALGRGWEMTYVP